jgi:hypothetical protein
MRGQAVRVQFVSVAHPAETSLKVHDVIGLIRRRGQVAGGGSLLVHVNGAASFQCGTGLVGLVFGGSIYREHGGVGSCVGCGQLLSAQGFLSRKVKLAALKAGGQQPVHGLLRFGSAIE